MSLSNLLDKIWSAIIQTWDLLLSLLKWVLHHLPGIPPEGSDEFIKFKDSFLPALWSGICYSILTGVIVGLFLNWNQRSLEAKMARRGYLRDLSLARLRLEDVFSQPDIFSITSALESVPPQAQKAMEYFQTLPLSVWQDQLPEQAILLTIINKFRKSYYSFRTSASKFDNLLAQFARSVDARSHTVAMHDHRVISFVLGTLEGHGREEIIKWIHQGDDPGLPSLDEAIVAARAEPLIMDAHGQYSKDRKALVDSLKELKTEIATSSGN